MGLWYFIFLVTASANGQSKKKYIYLCQHANKYKQVVLEALSWTLSSN